MFIWILFLGSMIQAMDNNQKVSVKIYDESTQVSVFGYQDGTIELHDRNHNLPKVFEYHKVVVKLLALDMHYHQLISYADDGFIVLWNFEREMISRQILRKCKNYVPQKIYFDVGINNERYAVAQVKHGLYATWLLSE